MKIDTLPHTLTPMLAKRRHRCTTGLVPSPLKGKPRTWTETRIQQLKQLWHQHNHHLPTISAAMNLPMPPESAVRAIRRQARQHGLLTTPIPQRATAAAYATPSHHRRLNDILCAELPHAPLPEIPKEPQPGKTLMELTDNDCPTVLRKENNEAVYCGRKKRPGKPVCEDHYNRQYKPESGPSGR